MATDVRDDVLRYARNAKDKSKIILFMDLLYPGKEMGLKIVFFVLYVNYLMIFYQKNKLKHIFRRNGPMVWWERRLNLIDSYHHHLIVLNALFFSFSEGFYQVFEVIKKGCEKFVEKYAPVKI